MSLDNRIWLGLLTLLNAVLFGIIFTVEHRHAPAAPPPPTTPPPVRQASTPNLVPTPIPTWSTESDFDRPLRTTTGATDTPVTADDIRPPASLELSAEFAESVRLARAAGIDEVLLAHAVVARFHRQTEGMIHGANGVQIEEAERDKARAETVINLLGESAYQGWQRSDYMMNHSLAGTDITAGELDLLIQLSQERDRKSREFWKSGNRDYRTLHQKLNAEYRNKLLRAFGQERARQLGLL